MPDRDPIAVREAAALIDAELERLRGIVGQIEAWCEAYPVAVFPEPDWAKARQLLSDGGMTLDAISASNMRRVLDGVRRIIEKG
jgi:hypothetical protein